MPSTRFACCTIALLAVPSACSKSSAGDSEPTPGPNEPPSLQVPSQLQCTGTGSCQLTGSGSSYSLTLAITNAVTLSFTAIDPDGESVQWQVIGATAPAASVGLTLPTVATGQSYAFQFGLISTPAAMGLVLLAQDSRGNATAIDLMIIRSGAPTITGVTPNSAFVSAGQPVTITGTALSLGGTAATMASFDGSIASFITIPNETTLKCVTPINLSLGPTIVSVNNTHGTATLPGSAFTAYSFPPIYGVADAALDSGAGSSAALARDGDEVHAAWIEGGLVVHLASNDGGATWGTETTLSGAEVPTEPQIMVTGQKVTIVWLGDGTSIQARSSSDGGSTFDPAVVLNPLAGTQIARQPRACASGDHRYVAWLVGNPALGAARLVVATSADAGTLWAAPQTVDDAGAQQAAHSIACDGSSAWVAFSDERQGSGIPGAYISRSVDGGGSWSPASLRSLPGTPISEPRLCADTPNVHVTWLRGGGMRYSVSNNAGAAWSPQVNLQDNSNGAVSAPALACDDNRIFAIYIAGGNSVWVSRITATGAAPQHTQLSTATVISGSPRVVHRGNYVFTVWRSDDVTTGAARILHSISVDIGQTFNIASGFGNGTAAQDEPLMVVDSAKVLFAWLDYRGTIPALFTNRNNP